MDKQTENSKRDSNTKISLVKAKRWAARWRKEEGTYNEHHKLYAFLIPKDDLTGVLLEKDVEAVRAYIGVEIKSDGTPEEKLMIVGVDENGADMLPRDTKNKGSIYDFTRPCPSACDPNSPLV